MSVRERSRLRPQLLERLGWRYMPLWTIEVFTDPSACADRIGAYLGLENVLLPGRTAAAGFFDEDVDSLALGTTGPEDTESQAAKNRNEYRAGSPESKEAVVVNPQNAGQPDQEQEPEDLEQEAAPGQQQAGAAGILPNKAAEDDPRRWGDAPDNDHDEWLKENKPPHWG